MIFFYVFYIILICLFVKKIKKIKKSFESMYFKKKYCYVKLIVFKFK